MSTNHEYTPTTGQVRDLFDREIGWDGAFDRWHAAEIAAAEQRGAINALREAAESDELIDHMYKHFDGHPVQIPPAAVRAAASYLHNRADQMETRND